jgi:hypothetical protein
MLIFVSCLTYIICHIDDNDVLHDINGVTFCLARHIYYIYVNLILHVTSILISDLAVYEATYATIHKVSFV